MANDLLDLQWVGILKAGRFNMPLMINVPRSKHKIQVVKG